MYSLIKIELWEDKDTSRCYVGEFLEGLGPQKAGSIIRVLEDVYEQLTFSDIVRDGKLEVVPEREGLFVLKVDKKNISVRLYGCVRESKIYLVHGVVKTRARNTNLSHLDTAQQRIKKIGR